MSGPAPTGRPKGYQKAVAWIAENETPTPSAERASFLGSVRLAAFLWGKDPERVVQDVRRVWRDGGILADDSLWIRGYGKTDYNKVPAWAVDVMAEPCRVLFPCPRCSAKAGKLDGFQPLEWDRLRPALSPGSVLAVYVCRFCETPIEDSDSDWMKANASWGAKGGSEG